MYEGKTPESLCMLVAPQLMSAVVYVYIWHALLGYAYTPHKMQFFIRSLLLMLCVFFLMGHANSESPKTDITTPNLRQMNCRQLSRISCDKAMPFANITTPTHRKFILDRKDFEITQADKTASLPARTDGNRRKFTIQREKKSQ